MLGMTKFQIGIEVVKWVYLVVLFTLLSGLFYYIINPGQPIDDLVLGVGTIILGLVGGIVLYKGILSRERRGMYMAIGYGLIAMSLYFIYVLAGIA